MKKSLFASLLALAACGSPPPPVTPPVATAAPIAAPTAAPIDESFRASPPAPGPAVVFTPPKIDEARLANGARVLVVEQHSLPIVAVSIAFDEGADQGPPAVGSLMGALLFRGTKTQSAVALSDALASLGARAGASTDYDDTSVAGKCATDKLSDFIAILADVVRHPAFAKDEVELQRSLDLTAIDQERDRPGPLLWNEVDKLLYPAKHPYATPLIGTAELVKKASIADLQAFYKAHLAPDRMTIVFAGDVDLARAKSEAERAFGDWSGKSAAAKSLPAIAAPSKGLHDVILVDRPNAPQSQVGVAAVGLARKSPDFDAVLVMNAILGGPFSSRLNMNLREGHAYTYGAGLSFEFRHAEGPFVAGGAIVRDKTAPAIHEIYAEIARLRSEPVSEAELADAKATLVKQLPARFETVEGTASTVATLAVLGVPLDEFATRAARIRKITHEDVRRVANLYLAEDALHLVVVGDAAAIKKSLDELGLGNVVVRAPISKPNKK